MRNGIANRSHPGPRQGMVVVLATSVVLSACSGGASTSSTTFPPVTSSTSPVSTSTSRPQATTTTVAPTTTTLRRSWDGDVLHPISPLEVLSSFHFEYVWFATDDEGDEYGVSAAGQYVFPEASYCRIDQPGMGGWTLLLELTAIGGTVWDDDGFFGVDQSERDSKSDFLAACPSAAEYWSSPPFAHESLELESLDSVEEIAGQSTTKLAIRSTVSDLVLESGHLWVTDQGWPIKFEMAGSGSGAAFNAFFGASGEGSPDHVDFEFHLDISDVNGPSLFVRSPDGSQMVGPTGEVSADITPFSPSSALDSVISGHSPGVCTEEKATAAILAELGPEPEFDSMSVTSTEEGSVFENVYVGTFVLASPDQVFKTTAEGPVADLHAELHFNHYRSLVAFFALVDSPYALIALNGDGSEASWDFGQLTRFDGTTEKTDYWYLGQPEDGYHRYPSQTDLLLDGSVYDEGWAHAATWAREIGQVLVDLPSMHPQAIADLKAISEDFESVEGLFCALLATGWVEAAQTFDTRGETYVSANPDVLFDELAAQQLLLVMEYVEQIIGRLSSPSVDWFDGPDLSFDRQSFDSTTSDVEYIDVLSDAAIDALGLYFEIEGARP